MSFYPEVVILLSAKLITSNLNYVQIIKLLLYTNLRAFNGHGFFFLCLGYLTAGVEIFDFRFCGRANLVVKRELGRRLCGRCHTDAAAKDGRG